MGAKRGTSKERLKRWTRYRPNGCLEFQGNRSRDGYGMIQHNGKSRLSHRVAYEIYNNESPGEMDVMHSCDNPRCVNPMHLSLGTHTDNMRDMFAKGRGYSPRGMNHPMAKLNPEKAFEIRWYAAMERKHKDIAAEYGVTRPLISGIVRGEQWHAECHD